MIYGDIAPITPTYKGAPIIPSRHAGNELMNLGLDLWFVENVLKEGYDCPSRKRKPGEIERCIKKGKAIYKVIAARSYSHGLKKKVWVVVHVGKFGRV